MEQRLGAYIISKDRDEFFREVCAFLQSLGIKPCDADPMNATQQLQEDIQFSVVLGGDGTVLAAARGRIVSPVVVINTGHLGFLTSANKNNYKEILQAVVSGKFTTTQRRQLEIEVKHQEIFGLPEWLYALNEVTISGERSKLIQVAVYVTHGVDSPEELIAEYRADGLIVSTPTGSTAYNLSAGGPIIHPNCVSFVITPICPQGLTQRPLVLPSNVCLRLLPLSDHLYASIDSQVEVPLRKNVGVTVKYNTHTIGFVNPLSTYYTILREKLAWGIKPV